jgi:hypothetical protein
MHLAARRRANRLFRGQLRTNREAVTGAENGYSFCGSGSNFMRAMNPPKTLQICVRCILAAYLLVFPTVGAGEDLAAAEKAARARLAAAEAEHGPDHPEVGLSLHALAAARLRQEKWEGTPPLMERAIAILEDAYGPDHDTVLDLLNNLALAVGKLGEIERAREIHERVLGSLERSHGHDDPSWASSPSCCGTRAASPRQEESTNSPWRSWRKRTAPSIA